MAIVNTLEVVVKATTDKFNAGMKKASGAVNKFADKNKTLGDVLTNTKSAILGVNPALALTVTVAVGAAAAIGKITIASALMAEQLQKNAIRLGTTTEALSQFNFAAAQSGATSEDVHAALLRVNEVVGLAKTEGGAAAEMFTKLGIAQADLEDSSPIELFKKISQGLNDLNDAQKAGAIGTALLGGEYGKLKPLMLEGAEGIAALQEEADALGATVSTDFANKSAAFLDNVGRMKAITAGFGQTIAVQVLPVLNGMLSVLITLGKEVLPTFNKELQDSNDKLNAFFNPEIVSKVGGFVLKVAEGFNKLTDNAKLLPGPIKGLRLYTKALTEAAEAGKKVRDGSQAAAEGVDALDNSLAPANEKLLTFSQTLTEILNQMKGTLAQNLEETVKAILAPLELATRAMGEDRPQILPSREEVQGFAEGTVTAFDLMRGRAQLFFDDLKAGARSSLEIAASFAEGFGDALVDSATEGTAAFSKFFTGLAKQLARAIVRALVLRTILSIFGLGPVSGSFLQGVGNLLVGSGGGQMIPPTRMGAILGTATAGGDPGALASGGGNIASNVLQPSVRVQILEPSPLTRVQFVDDVVAPRMRQRSDELNEEPL